jgi:hypothetical protein
MRKFQQMANENRMRNTGDVRSVGNTSVNMKKNLDDILETSVKEVDTVTENDEDAVKAKPRRKKRTLNVKT